MARRPAFAKAFMRRWRIVEMDQWDNDYLDLLEPAFIELGGSDGSFLFGTVRGWLDLRNLARDGEPCVEFSWEGLSDGDRHAKAEVPAWAPQAASSATSSSTTATTQASSPSWNDFFNALLAARLFPAFTCFGEEGG